MHFLLRYARALKTRRYTSTLISESVAKPQKIGPVGRVITITGNRIAVPAVKFRATPACSRVKISGKWAGGSISEGQ